MTAGLRPANVGSQWEDTDPRAGLRVVVVIETRRRFGINQARYEVKVASRRPWTVGRKRWMRESTLRARYYRISH
jgi:hypothetical protein